MSLRGRLRRAGELVLGAAAACAVGACSGDAELRCEEPGDYVSSRSAPPIRVPDDLSPPSEDEALRVPASGRDAAAEDEPRNGCLERPPDYFEGGEAERGDGR